MTNQYQYHISSSFNSVTELLDNCCRTHNLIAIKGIHAHLLRAGLLFGSLFIHTKLIFSYTTCLLHKDNFQTLTNCFRFLSQENPLPFNILISDFCRNGFAFHALKTFSFMHVHDVSLDTYALCSSLTASSSIKDVVVGKQIHAHVIKSGWASSVFVGSALIDLYGKLLYVNDAEMVFDEIPSKNSVCANVLLSGYCEAKLWGNALNLIRLMPVLELNYDRFSISAILRACAGICSAKFGRQVHAYLIRKVYSLENDVIMQSSLIEMYGKCGLVSEALQVFNLSGHNRIRIEEERNKDVVLWTSILGVYGRNGYFRKVIELYNEMLMEGVKPDEVVFLAVISACAHSGQVNLGIEYFESMVRDHNLDPTSEHYSCLVDLFCRAGELDKAWKLMNEMFHRGHSSGSVSMWGALLSACYECGNLELGKLAAEKALELDPANIGVYVMLSNLYAKLSMWDEISHLRELMKEKGLEKEVGSSCIQIVN